MRHLQSAERGGGHQPLYRHSQRLHVDDDRLEAPQRLAALHVAPLAAAAARDRRLELVEVVRLVKRAVERNVCCCCIVCAVWCLYMFLCGGKGAALLLVVCSHSSGCWRGPSPAAPICAPNDPTTDRSKATD